MKQKKGFYYYSKLTRRERREFRKAHQADKYAPLKPLLSDTYADGSWFLSFAFSWRVSPQGGAYWKQIADRMATNESKKYLADLVAKLKAQLSTGLN